MDHTQYTTNKAERKPGKHLIREDRGAIEAMMKVALFHSVHMSKIMSMITERKALSGLYLQKKMIVPCSSENMYWHVKATIRRKRTPPGKPVRFGHG